MDNLDVNNFYIGNLNLGFYMDSSMSGNPNLKKEDELKNTLFNKTVEKGAIDLRRNKFERVVNWERRLNYRCILTIFCKKDDNHYLCLHNKYVYPLEGTDYCSNLVPIKDVVPKVDYELDKTINYEDASKLFDGLFKDNRYFQYKQVHNIDEFYYGNLDLCIGYSGDNKFHDLNTNTGIILYSNPKLYKQSGNSVIENDVEYDYMSFNSIFLKIDQNLFYNINDYQHYTLEKSLDRKQSIIKIVSPLSAYFDENNIKYPKEITISKILKLQKKTK